MFHMHPQDWLSTWALRIGSLVLSLVLWSLPWLPTPHLLFSIAVHCTELALTAPSHPWPLVDMYVRTRKGKCVGMQPAGKPVSLSCDGLSQKPVWDSFSFHYHWFSFSLLCSTPKAWLADPLSEFPWFRLYAFSSKPSSFINLHSFVISMLRSILIPLDSFWQSAATFSCLAWIQKVIYQFAQMKWNRPCLPVLGDI